MPAQIITTLGPASETYPILKRLAEEGVDIVRINFSHATYDQYRRIAADVKKIAAEAGHRLAIMQDLQGPRIRVGHLDHEVVLSEGETYAFTYLEGKIDNLEIPIDDQQLITALKVGQPLFLGNGEIEMRITEADGRTVRARVERGGILRSRKGINAPQTDLERSGLTEKDLDDARFAVKEGVDYIALSFVQSADDIIKLRALIQAEFPNLPQPKLIAKIERAAALGAIDEIVQATDGIMIARGDLGIELPLEELPILQKNLIRHAHWHDKPAIVATEMLTSMVEHVRPTRAEVGDIANAIFDGADALMLSDESAVGKYPIEAVMMMNRVILRTEEYRNGKDYFEQAGLPPKAV